MKKVTILIPKIKPPEQPDIISNQLKNILSALEKKCELSVFWIIFQPKSFRKYQYDKSEVIDFHDFKNAIDVIEKINPDLIISEVRLGINGIAFAKAGINRKIPVVTITPTGGSEYFSTLYSTKTNLQLISSDEVLADVSRDDSQKFGMLRYSIKRYFFLINTLKQIGFSVFQLLKFMTFYPRIQLFSKSYPALDKITSGDLNVCFNKHWYDRLCSAGFDPTKIFLVGDPAFDALYHTIQEKFNSIPETSDKVRILFCPTPMHEHGWMKKKDEENLIISLIKAISKESKFEISLKIHPSSSSYHEYTKLLNSHKVNIQLLQKENTFELIHNSDLVLTYGSSNVILDSVLLKTPIIYYKIPNIEEMNRLLDKEIIFEFDQIDSINNTIGKSLSKNISEKNYQNYLAKQIGKFDGNNSIEIADKLLQLVY